MCCRSRRSWCSRSRTCCATCRRPRSCFAIPRRANGWSPPAPPTSRSRGGTGSSQGIAEDEYPAVERTDLLTVIDWLATQDWSTGSVGMYGTSYSGFNSIQLAMERPPALKAIIPIYATDDRYADDVHYFGGALKALDLVDYPSYMTGLNALPPVPALYGEGWREVWEKRVHENEPWVIRWLEEQTFGPYWQHGSLRPDYGG